MMCQFRQCEGFRMTADRDDAACTGAVVRKPPMKETALGERVAVPRALIYRGLTLAAAVICEHNFCVMARTLLRSFMMQMSARNVFGVRYVFDGRSRDRLAQRSSGLRMLLGPSPPSNIRRSIAPSVVGTPAPHAAAPYRASGFVHWHL